MHVTAKITQQISIIVAVVNLSGLMAISSTFLLLKHRSTPRGKTQILPC